MYGIWSTWSRKWCFGIIARTKEEAFEKLEKRIGWDAAKVRFEARQLSKENVREIQEQTQRMRFAKKENARQRTRRAPISEQR
jgi:hypothetical protein